MPKRLGKKSEQRLRISGVPLSGSKYVLWESAKKEDRKRWKDYSKK